MDVEGLKDAFWQIVADCLEGFHGYEASAARHAALDLRNRVESPRHRDLPPQSYDGDLFYHGEPFYVTCDIAGRQLDLAAHRATYECIVADRYDAVEQRIAAVYTEA